MFGLFKKKPVRDTTTSKFTLTPRQQTIVKCIKENAPDDFFYCKKCDYTSHCNRLRRKVL